MIKKTSLTFWAVTVMAIGFTLPAGAESVKKTDEFKINGKPVPDVVASVNGVNVPAQVLTSEMSAYKMLMEKEGREFPAKDQEKMARDIVGRAIDQELIYQKSKAMKIQVDQEVVEKEMEQIRKQFPSDEIFQSALAFQRHTVASLKTKIEKQLTDEEFVRREIAPKVNIDDSKAEAYYNENKKYFTKPEQFEVSHIFVSGVGPNEGKADEPASQQKASRIVGALDQEARAKINAVLQKIKKGENFAELAKKYSDDEATKSNGGSLGSIQRENLIPELGDVMVKLKAGETSEVVKSPYGYHIVKLTGKTPPQIAPFAEAKSDILNFLLKKEVEVKRKAYLDQLKKTANIKTFL